MAWYKEIDEVPTQVLASDLPEEIEATVLNVERDVKKGAYAGAPLLKLTLKTTNGITFTVNYRIPKSKTGHGQLDMFMEQLKKLKVEPKDIINKSFVWKKLSLEGSVQGNPRFYPTKLLGKKA